MCAGPGNCSLHLERSGRFDLTPYSRDQEVESLVGSELRAGPKSRDSSPARGKISKASETFSTSDISHLLMHLLFRSLTGELAHPPSADCHVSHLSLSLSRAWGRVNVPGPFLSLSLSPSRVSRTYQVPRPSWPTHAGVGGLSLFLFASLPCSLMVVTG